MKTHLLFIPNPEYLKAKRTAHPVRFHGKIMILTEEHIQDWLEFNKKYPHTYCNEIAKDVNTTDDISQVTCKVCLKSFKSQEKEKISFGIT